MSEPITDTQRLDWLSARREIRTGRGFMDSFGGGYSGPAVFVCGPGGPDEILGRGRDLREAIDAAMSAATQPGG